MELEAGLWPGQWASNKLFYATYDADPENFEPPLTWTDWAVVKTQKQTLALLKKVEKDFMDDGAVVVTGPYYLGYDEAGNRSLLYRHRYGLDLRTFALYEDVA